MKITTARLTLLSCALTLSACQPHTSDATAQQHFICQSLIEGFLKTQHLSQYKLWHIEPALQHAASYRRYIYQAQVSNNMNLFPRQQKLAFNCEQLSTRQFQIQFSDPAQQHVTGTNHLLSLQLPEPKQMKQLTAYALTSSNTGN